MGVANADPARGTSRLTVAPPAASAVEGIDAKNLAASIVPAEAMETSSPGRDRQRDRILVAGFASGIAGRLITPAFGALAVAAATRALGDSRYGVVATIGSLAGLMIFTDLGVGNAFMTRLAKAHAEDDGPERQAVVSSAWFFLLGAGAVVLLLGVAASLVLPWPALLGAPQLPPSGLRLAVFAVFVVFAVGMPATMGQRVMMSLQRGAAANVWAVAAAILTPGAVALAWILHAPLWAFVLATVGVPVAVAVVQTGWVLTRTYPELRPTRVHAGSTTMRSLVRVGGLYLTLNFATAVAFQTDSVIVAGVQGAAAAGVYAIASRLFRMVSGLGVIGSEQLWTVATAALATGDIDWLRSRMLRVVSLSTAAIGLICAVLVLVGRPFISLWAGGDLVPPLSLLIWAAVLTVYMTAMTQVIFLLNAADVVRPQVVMALTMAAANITLSIYLTHRFGVIGPVVGSLVAHVCCYGVPALIIARRILRPQPVSAPSR
jgi:O-antigen/teichoic acid export membrane protein